MEFSMEEPDKNILIKNCLSKSRQAISDAIYNIKDGRQNTALNRIYYSIFYSVMALAYKEGFITSSHSQLMGWFNKKFIYEEKIFDNLLNDIYKHAYKQRQESDYNLIISENIPDNFVRQELKNARLFIKAIKKYIEEDSGKKS